MNRALALLALLLASAPAGAATAVGKAAPPARRAPAIRDARAVPFVADDYTRALAEARARRVPLFIEAWAPW